MIWGDDTEFKALESQNKICSAMTEEEKSLEAPINSVSRTEIAEVTQLQPQDVSDVIAKYKQMTAFHKWLTERRARGEPMPESRDDLMMIYKIEKPEFLMAKPNKYKRLSPTNRMKMLMRKHT